MSKKNLRKILSALSPQDKPDLIAQDLREEIKAVESKIQTPKDYSGSLDALKLAVLKLQDNFQAKLATLTSKEEIQSLTGKFNIELEKIKAVIPTKYDDTALKEELLAEIEKLTLELKKVRIEALNKGGGNANRQINVKSSVMSQKYTDINYQNGGGIQWTATDDNTNKRVNITASLISGGGGASPAAPTSAVQFNLDGTNFGATNLNYDNTKSGFATDIVFADNDVPETRQILVKPQSTIDFDGTNLVVKAGDGNSRNNTIRGGDITIAGGDVTDGSGSPGVDGFGGHVTLKPGKNVGEEDGYVRIYAPTQSVMVNLSAQNLSTDRFQLFQNKDATFAYIGDNISEFVNDAGYITGGSFANTALSNLGTTALNKDLLPGSVIGINVGSPTLPFSSVFANDEYRYRNNRAIYANPTNNVWYFGSQGTASAITSATQNNIGIGKGALDALTSIASGISSSDNVGIGLNALGSVTTGLRNVAIGTNAMAGGGLADTQTTVAIGYGALSGVSGNSNVAIGANAMSNGIGTGTSNVAIGINCLRDMTNGNDNLGLGSSTLLKITTAAYNTAYGSGALSSITAGSRNVAIGRDTGSDLTGTNAGNLSSDNILIGYNTGRGITTGRSNVIIGAQVTGLASTLSNNIILADGVGNIRYRYSGGTTSIFGGIGVTGKVTAYNSSVTAGMGVPAIYGARPTPASVAGNSSVIAYVPTSVAGMYRTNGVITTTSGTNTGTLQLTLDYVDSFGTTHTGDIIPLNDSASGLVAASVTGASKEFDGNKSFTINNSGTVVALKVVTSGSVSYTATGTVEQLI